MSIKFYNRGNKTGEVWLYGVVGDDFGGMTDKQFVQGLNDLGRVDTLSVRINSEGGSVFDGFAIYNALVRHPAKVEVHVDAFAGSIASIIAMAGDSINMAANSMMMIHEPSAPAWGDSRDLRQMADVLDGIRGQLVDTYAARTKQQKQMISDWMLNETWLTASDAVANGFADKITAELKVAALLDVNKYRNKTLPRAFVDRIAAHRYPDREANAARIADMERRLNSYRNHSD